MNSQAAIDPNVLPSPYDNPFSDEASGYLEVDYAGSEHITPEISDNEATTLNHGPHTGYYPMTPYSYSHPAYFGEPAPLSTPVGGGEDDDTSMSDDEGNPPPSAAPAFSAVPHPYHQAIPPLPHEHSLAVNYPVMNPIAGPGFSTPAGLLPDSEGLPYAPATFHIDAADSEGLVPGTLPPQNPSLFRFLELWSATGGPRGYRQGVPWYPSVTALAKSDLRHVAYGDLRGHRGDAQGLDWYNIGVSRKYARAYRMRTYRNFVNIRGSDAPCVSGSPRLVLPTRDTDDRQLTDPKPLPNTGSYYRFHDMHVRGRSIRLNHFQLRHILASSTRSRSFYPEAGGIRQINPLSGKDQTFVDLRDMENGGIVSTLAATDRVLVAATFNGEYCVKNLGSAERGHHTGKITDDPSGITTHAQIYAARQSGAPTAAFASNDRVFRTLDLATQKFTLQTTYNFPINCSALSPDRRLRVMVGDNRNAVVVNAETGAVERELSGHRDFGFACDWADDGWTVATGSQDMTVRVWDARRWCDSDGVGTPVATLRSEMAGVRSLRFSPAGSGKRVLVAAEEADFVNVFDAKDLQRKQTLDMFGEIGGVDFCDGGRELQVLCCDWARGGLARFERCDWWREAAEVGYEEDEEGEGFPGAGFDWGDREGVTRRWRRGVRGVGMDPF